jgi:hypothetical protein
MSQSAASDHFNAPIPVAIGGKAEVRTRARLEQSDFQLTAFVSLLQGIGSPKTHTLSDVWAKPAAVLSFDILVPG